MKSIKICRICEQFPPANGGLSSGMLDLSLAQHERGHEITIITRSSPDDSQFDAKLPFSVIRIPSKRIFDFGLKAYKVIRELSMRPDIVHSHGPATFYYLIRKNKADSPIVHTMHAVRRYQFRLFKDLPEVVETFEKRLGIRAVQKPDFYKPLSPKVRKELFLERYICQRADHIVVVAKYFVDQIKKYYGVRNDKISVAYNGSGFDSDEVLNADISKMQSFGINTNKEIILYVGRTDWVKRVHLLVEAMPALLKRFPDACLVVAGRGNQDVHLTRLLERLGLNKSVKLIGWVPHKDLLGLFKIAKCFCLPSYWEGLSKSLLEAMSARVPVIATDNLSNREVLQDGALGWLVAEANPVAWSTTIERILAGGIEVEKKVRKGSTLLDQMYRWNHVALRIDAAYQKVLGQ